MMDQYFIEIKRVMMMEWQSNNNDIDNQVSAWSGSNEVDDFDPP